MIISCPECAGPFEVPDDRIAALVQVACPHCAFRMILDFAAANDPGLVEQGMRMASGFRSAADYHASVQLAAQPVTPVGVAPVEVAPVEPEAEPLAAEATTDEPVAAPALEVVAPVQPAPIEPVRAEAVPPVRVRPEPAVQAEPPVRVRPEPSTPAPTSPRTVTPTPVREPVRPAAQARTVSEEARTEVHMLPRGAERMVPVDIPPVRRPPQPRPDEDDIRVTVPAPATEIVRSTTVVGPPPTPPAAEEVAIDIDDEDEGDEATTPDQPPMRPAPTADEDAAHPAFGSEEDEDVPTMVVTPETRDAARREMDAMAARRSQPQPEPEIDRTPSGRERPRPPHTPPGRAKVATREDEAPTAAVDRSGRRSEAAEEAETGRRPPVRPSEVAEGSEDEVEQERMSTFGVVLVVLLLLIAGGLVGASVALNEDHSPDPRPLLEKLYRQHIKGEPTPAKAEPAKAEPAKK